MATQMISENLFNCLLAGYERLAAWSDVVDRINVFPVPDGDTGRNMVMCMLPLLDGNRERKELVRQLMISARGNSGNIAANFLSGFIGGMKEKDLSSAAKEGCAKAWQAIHAPQTGTMLSVMDSLSQVLEQKSLEEIRRDPDYLVNRLEDTVRTSVDLLPALQEAGVVDAGALGMFLFLEGFFQSLADRKGQYRSINESFPGLLSVSYGGERRLAVGYCVDTVLEMNGADESVALRLAEIADEAVVSAADGYLKLHLHTTDTAGLRKELASMGELVAWEEDDLAEQSNKFRLVAPRQALAIITDAAGSLTPLEAAQNGIILLNSYINIGGRSLPETYVKPEKLYVEMRKGTKVSTSQASLLERHQAYEKTLDIHGRVLYLCVGSAYTGNFQVAEQWKNDSSSGDDFMVMDTGAASGRLGLMALMASRFSSQADTPEQVADYAGWAMEQCREYIFLDNLKYLAAGGRVPKAKAWIGDFLGMKPVVTTTKDGVQKVGVTRKIEEQLEFALDCMKKELVGDQGVVIMLQYTDNLEWLEQVAQPTISREYPNAEILIRPLSLTTGAHCGPGTWAVAYLPQYNSTAGKH
jgi:DegV family protein with EDD domain